MAARAQIRQLESIDAALGWLAERGVRALTTDSRWLNAGDAFIAWPGYATDGRRYVPAALADGASACLVEADGAAEFESLEGAAIASMAQLKQNTGPLASRFMDVPSGKLDVIAVTGTNGKTSTAWWVAQALSSLGRRCGVIGTLGVGEPPSANQAAAITFTGMTTPDPITVQSGFKKFADAGLAACAIEATSIGIAEHRLDGTQIDVALFTNLTQDHLDYHGSMGAYWDAKARLFAWPGLRSAVINIDDAQGAKLVQSLDGGGLDVWTYSASDAARLRASSVHYAGGGLSFELHEGGARAHVATRLIGDYNVANLLAAIGALRALNVSLEDAAQACGLLTPVPGRMQRVEFDSAAPQVVVDYAHTPDALDKALRALRPFAAERGGKLWSVFGCGGNRDVGKRPVMGELSQRLADQTVITSDNPRNESPAFILSQIVAGLVGALDRVEVIEDRRAAIAHAVRGAAANDVILVAGKGHEDYQDIGGVKQHFSDVEEALASLRARGGASA